MLWIKALHIIFVASWFTGLFYLPRIFVNLAMESDEASLRRLFLMANKLYRFTNILILPAILPGLWLWLFYGIGRGSDWLVVKLLFVLASIFYHFYCGYLLKQFKCGKNTRSHIWYRYFNEIPIITLSAATILVVVKPF